MNMNILKANVFATLIIPVLPPSLLILCIVADGYVNLKTPTGTCIENGHELKYYYQRPSIDETALEQVKRFYSVNETEIPEILVQTLASCKFIPRNASESLFSGESVTLGYLNHNFPESRYSFWGTLKNDTCLFLYDENGPPTVYPLEYIYCDADGYVSLRETKSAVCHFRNNSGIFQLGVFKKSSAVHKSSILSLKVKNKDIYNNRFIYFNFYKRLFYS